jgi:hypothetical protein
MTGQQIIESAEPAEPAPATRSWGRRWRWIGGIVAAVLVVAGGAWAIVANQDDDPTSDTARIGRMHQGCQQWADSYQGPDGPNDAWCTSMADWMADRTGPNASAGSGMMMGPTMWQDPASMQAACEDWMSTNPSGVPVGADAPAWCGQMVDWMDQHMGGWDRWMRDGPMTGDG